MSQPSRSRPLKSWIQSLAWALATGADCGPGRGRGPHAVASTNAAAGTIPHGGECVLMCRNYGQTIGRVGLSHTETTPTGWHMRTHSLTLALVLIGTSLQAQRYN